MCHGKLAIIQRILATVLHTSLPCRQTYLTCSTECKQAQVNSTTHACSSLTTVLAELYLSTLIRPVKSLTRLAVKVGTFSFRIVSFLVWERKSVPAARSATIC